MSTLTRLFAALAITAPIVACQLGDQHETIELPLREVSTTRTCDSPFQKPNVGELEACGDGKGHCFEATKSPLDPTQLPDCGGGRVCVPDKVLSAGGTKLKACTFFLQNKPGACVSLLLKDINAHKGQLQPDVCDPDERCAPCINPQNGLDTHLCDDVGVHEAACKSGSGEADDLCCHGAGVCINREAAPPDKRDDLIRDTCDEGKACAPTSMVDGAPVKCDVLGASGVCIDLCFANMLRGAKTVLRGGCGPTEACLPCVIGKGQGVVGCD